MRFDRRVYGPGPLRSPGSRVLLATPGVDYTDEQAAAIRARAINLDGPGPAAAAPSAPAVPAEPVRDEHGLINRGNGWYELANGERVRGRDNAIAAAQDLAGMDSAGDGVEGTGIEVPADGSEAELDADEDGLSPLGGDWWLLPDGQRIQGRDAAEEALAALDEAESA